ncbi:MAG: carboxypeptidase regulatory-like domain-containing protein [Bryobacterales bacterium]|nr:carboxypeptidase regulatory-like domain-containing protein [Bryobacterales bacterium]
MKQFSLLFAVFLCLVSADAQETRSMLFGRVLDPQGAAIVGASVEVRNVQTGVALAFRTNDTGYYEANLLLPGEYELTASMDGFKKLLRRGVRLPVSSRLQVDLAMELGGVAETVSVTAEAPLLETNAVSSGRVLDNKSVMELPVMGNSAMLLVKLTPGIQTGGVNNYLALHSNAGGSDYSVNGNIGGNSWTLDGSPNQGPGRRTAYLPYTDAVAEFKVETTNFDASIGQSSGAAISMISKSGSNDLHGTMTWQHWQQRWQGSPFFVKQQYYNRINAAEAAGNTALANQIRNTDKQPTGRSNNWGISGGGPLVIPKLYNGKNKLFWFLTYNGFKDVKVEDPNSITRTVPTLNARNGDFSDMLTLLNGTRYTVHDPITVRTDPARPRNFIRTPFPGNVIPKSRFVNPAYDAVNKLYPLPNNNPAPGQDPVNNYLASQTPYNWDYKAYSNRIDYQINDRWRMFGRWSFNDFGPEDRSDWTYETSRGLNSNGLNRNNKGGNIDVVYTQSPTMIWNLNVAMNQFREGNIQPTLEKFKPTDLGLPAYMDQRAGDLHVLPLMNVNGYSQISPGGLSVFTRTRIMTVKLEGTKILGNHTLRAAFDNRNHFRTGGGGGNTSGNFTFADTYTRRNDDGFTPSSNLGLGWAAFILGTPNGIGLATNDSYAMHNPYYASFLQDSWRVTDKLTLNLGLRMEYERAATERYNRMIGNFDPSIELPFAQAAQAAYARNPIPELPASQFVVRGSNRYAGVDGNSRNLYKNELMWLPRVGAAYRLKEKTAIRAGYGIFFDTINVLNFGPDQYGYSRNTSPIITTDFGQTWNFPANANPANGNSPLRDPFPLRADGTRFDEPTGSLLGTMARPGRGFTYTDFNQPHARQQRWRAGVQHQIGKNMVVEAAYSGTYSDRISISRNMSPLPEQYWASGLTRNNAIADNLNANVTNPYYINNFNASMFTPAVWADIRTNGFFNSPTIRRNTLLRPFSHMNGLTNNHETSAYTKSHEVQLSFEKRFAAGWNMHFGYTATSLREADFYLNEFDTTRTERISNDGRPQRIVASGIYELPFGRGRKFASGAAKPVDMLVGGWQLSATYEFQPGPLIDWGNVFFYGDDRSQINNVNRTFDTWFNTANFERTAARGPAAFHRRVFPTRINDMRRDMTNLWNGNIAKNVRFDERWNLQLRLDAINLTNRSQMNAPNTDPYSSNFGRITSQTAATNRWIQVQARVTF